MTSKKQTNKDVERNLADIYEIAAICERSAKETYKTEADQIEAFRVRMNDIIKLFIDAIEETVDGWDNKVDDVNVGDDDDDIATCDNCGKPVTEKDTEFIDKVESGELSEEEMEEIARKAAEEGFQEAIKESKRRGKAEEEEEDEDDDKN